MSFFELPLGKRFEKIGACKRKNLSKNAHRNKKYKYLSKSRPVRVRSIFKRTMLILSKKIFKFQLSRDCLESQSVPVYNYEILLV